MVMQDGAKTKTVVVGTTCSKAWWVNLISMVCSNLPSKGAMTSSLMGMLGSPKRDVLAATTMPARWLGENQDCLLGMLVVIQARCWAPQLPRHGLDGGDPSWTATAGRRVQCELCLTEQLLLCLKINLGAAGACTSRASPDNDRACMA